MSAHLISVIGPVFNEAENLGLLIPALARMGRPFALIVVDHGSSDDTAMVLRDLHRPALRVVQLRRNTGQTAALMAGLHAAKGDVLVSVDGDLQNDPVDIAPLVAELDEGFNVVSGWRTDRKDAAIRRNLLSRVANRFVSAVSGIHR